MGKIKILTEKVANQIAAGETIESTASIIKELIENSIDAKASQIDIILEQNGLNKITIKDNGIGMDPEDIHCCFFRHATSKIESLSDLSTITSYGFRGEAISAIASVCKMTITSRSASSQFAIKISLMGEKLINTSRAGRSIGTTVDIESLFFNTPVRLKFLKDSSSELKKIEDIIKQFSLANHNIHYRLFLNEYLKLNLIPIKSIKELQPRIIDCLNKDLTNHLFYFEKKTSNFLLNGFLSSPYISRKDSLGLLTYVNNRFIKSSILIQSIKIAYDTLMQNSRYPLGVLFFYIQPEYIDINIHPQKAQIKFLHTDDIQKDLILSIKSFLSNTPWSYNLNKESNSTLKNNLINISPVLKNKRERLFPITESHNALLKQEKEKYCDLKFIGQIFNTFLILEKSHTLILIDQHAAHERINFERLNMQKNKIIPSRRLLFPQIITVSRVDLLTLLEKIKIFSEYGFELEPFGASQVCIKSIPIELSDSQAKTLILNTLSDLHTENWPTSLISFSNKIISTIACHASIKAGQHLKTIEVKSLLSQLDAINYSTHCPHGRPVTYAISSQTIAKWFSRT
ncbi:MAG: DNA mismatch repair endonuclease MutL [Deltaproteobacteria bacterium]|nr:MAG: DNA mismatch repair endonuclease MutL [Deltaproteobacteria bacterium]